MTGSSSGEGRTVADLIVSNLPRPTSVAEADRKAAADAVLAYRGHKNNDWQGRIRRGEVDDGTMVQAFARHRIAAAAEVRKELIAKGCVHKAKAGERTSERPDIAAWQEAQSEFFDATICEIVSEYAAWRDAQTTDLTAAAQLHRSGLITKEKFNHICENIRARDVVRSARDD